MNANKINGLAVVSLAEATKLGAVDHALYAPATLHLRALQFTGDGQAFLVPLDQVRTLGVAAFGRLTGRHVGRVGVVGALLGRPAPAWDARAASHLLLVHSGGDREEWQARDLFARGCHAHLGLAGVAAASSPRAGTEESAMPDRTISTIRPDRDDGRSFRHAFTGRGAEGGAR